MKRKAELVGLYYKSVCLVRINEYNGHFGNGV